MCPYAGVFIEMTVHQIHNVLRTYFYLFNSKEVESISKDQESLTSRDRVTISPEAKKRLEEISQSEER